MTFYGIFKIGPLELCGNEFQSTGSNRLTVCTSTDSYYYFSAYTWGQKRNSFLQGSSGPIFKIPKNVISYEPTEPTFEWAKLFCDISLTLLHTTNNTPSIPLLKVVKQEFYEPLVIHRSNLKSVDLGVFDGYSTSLVLFDLQIITRWRSLDSNYLWWNKLKLWQKY